MPAELPDVIAVRTGGLSPVAVSALVAAGNRSEWIRTAIEHYAKSASPDLEGQLDAIKQEMAAIREELRRLQVGGAVVMPSAAPSERTESNPEAAQAAASILEAFGL